MVEPSYGFSAALSTLQANRPAEGGTSLYSAASELSAASRSLQMSQGAISGQTQAISQMSQAQAQQMQVMSQMINNLNFSVNQLASSVSQQAGAQRMATMMPSAPALPAGGYNPTGMISDAFSAAGSMAASAGRGAMAAGAFGARVAGGFAGAMAAPFFGAVYNPAMPGQQMGSVGNAGFARSAVMGTGFAGPMGGNIGVGRNFSMATEAGADRAGFKAGEIGLGAMGGIANLGGNVLGGLGRMGSFAGAMGGGIGGAIGGAVGGAPGGAIGTILGTAGGGALMGGPVGAAAALAGLAVTKAVEASVGHVMEKIGEVRGNGEMFGRNAFRFSPSGLGRRTSQIERTGFGASMARMGTEDLGMTNGDLQETFAGGIENDMFRGVSGAQQASTRLRQLKDAVKTITQTLGTSIRESTDLMGQMQGAGIGVGNIAGSFLAGSSVQGLTRDEAISGQMGFVDRFRGSGMQGQGLFNLAGQSQALGQTAMRQGLLSSEQIAAVGGRSGVNQVMGNVTMGLMNSGLGTMNLAAGMGRGMGNVSGNALSALGQAGGMGTAAGLIGFAANRDSLARDALKDPAFRVNMLEQISSMADQFKGMGTKKDRMKLAMKSMGIDGIEAGVFLDMMAAEPAAQADRLNELTRSMSDLQANQLAENFSPTRRMGRSFDRMLEPVVEGGANFAARLGDSTNNTIVSARNKMFGISGPVAQRKGDLTMDDVLAGRGSRSAIGGAAGDVINSQPDSELTAKAKTHVEALGVTGDHDLETLRNTEDKDKKKSAAERLIAKLSGDMGSNDPKTKKAIALALGQATGQDVVGMLFAGDTGGVTAEDTKRLANMSETLQSELTSGGDQLAFGAAGAALGGILAVPTFGLSIAAGAALGVAFAGNQLDGEAVNKIGRSENAKRYLKNKKAIESGSLSGDALTKAKQEMAEDKVKMSKEGLSGDSISKIEGLSGSSLDSVLGVLSDDTWRRAGGAAGADAAMMNARNIADKAGLTGIGSQFAGGLSNIDAAFASIASASGKDQDALREKGGGYLVDAAMLTSGSSREQVSKLLGGMDVSDLYGPDGQLKDVKAVRELIARQSTAVDTNRAVTGSNAFNATQTAQQLELASQIQTTAALLQKLTDTVERIGLKNK